MSKYASPGRRSASVVPALVCGTALAAAGILAAGSAAMAAAGTPQHKNGKVTLCHATPPATAKNGWVQITVSTNAVTHHGHGDHADDIIPAFSYWTKDGRRAYPGKNLDTNFGGATGQQILANGCAAPSPSSSAPGGSRPAGGSHGHSGGHGQSGGHGHSGGVASGGGDQHKNGKVTLCHATPPASAKNGWVQITVSTNAVTHHGHGDHADDIIPSFDYWVKNAQHVYPGKNLSTTFGSSTGEQLLASGCTMPTAPSSSAPASGPASGSSSNVGASGAAAPGGSSTDTAGAGAPGAGATGSGVAGIAVVGSSTGSTANGVNAGTGTGENGTWGQGTGGNGAAGGHVPQGNRANGIASGDTGDHGSAMSPGVTAAAVVGGSLAALIGLAVLAIRRRNNGADA